jgi:hypothetical protein
MEDVRQEQKEKREGVWSGLFWIFAVLLLLYACGKGLSDTSGHPTFDITWECEHLTKSKLKSPASAQFEKYPPVELLPDGSYRLRSYVDSQNSFGAMLRSRYLCLARKLPNGKIEVTSHVLLPN